MIHARAGLAFALGIALTNAVIAVARESNSASAPQNTPSTIKTLDQLIEQNQRLEKQNQQIVEQNQQLEKQNQLLMEEINVMRGGAPQHTEVSEKAAEPAPPQATAGVKVGQAGQSSSPDLSGAGDKSAPDESR